MTQALIAEKEWLETLTQRISEVQSSLKQSEKQVRSVQVSPAVQQPVSQPLPWSQSAIPHPHSLAVAKQEYVVEDDESEVQYTPTATAYQSDMIGTQAADNDDNSLFVLPVTAADAGVEAPARLQLTLGAELADDDHHLVHEQTHRRQRYTSSDIDFGLSSPKISLAVGGQLGSKRTTRSTRDEETSWTLLSHNARPDVDSTPTPLRDAPVGTLAGAAAVLMNGVFAAGRGSVFLTESPDAQPRDEPRYNGYTRTADADVYPAAAAKQSVKQALYGC